MMNDFSPTATTDDVVYNPSDRIDPQHLSFLKTKKLIKYRFYAWDSKKDFFSDDSLFDLRGVFCFSFL